MVVSNNRGVLRNDFISYSDQNASLCCTIIAYLLGFDAFQLSSLTSCQTLEKMSCLVTLAHNLDFHINPGTVDRGVFIYLYILLSRQYLT